MAHTAHRPNPPAQPTRPAWHLKDKYSGKRAEHLKFEMEDVENRSE